MNHTALLSELDALRSRVEGISDAAVASVDGMLLTGRTERAHPETLAALAAAMLGLARSAGQQTGSGEFCETVTRFESGYIAVYALGSECLLVVLTDRHLNLARLHLEARNSIRSMSAALFGERRPVV
ncbi:roadblock/LC7 domain-containing protein [Streptomyces sp. NPDC000987]|uniref:roadblock/LC7 domain-containing protein n=1 Tax=Streptomyces sp. NPDC000987 TaxID=3154374 RepID=UPI0033231AB6